MSDYYTRCRFYPHCTIHAGRKPPRQFSAANRHEMAELHEQGWLYTEIADAFGTHPNIASAIIRTGNNS